MEIKDKKKVYTIFIVCIIALFVLTGLAGILIGKKVSDNKNNKITDPSAAGIVEQQSAEGASNAAQPMVTEPTIAVISPSTTATAGTTLAAVDAGNTVGGYKTGFYYVDNTGGKKLALRKTASSDGEKIGEIPANTKVEATQIIKSDDTTKPYWAKVTYNGATGYLVMQYLTPEAEFNATEATTANKPDTTKEDEEDTTKKPVGNYKSGTYTVATGGYGIIVRDAPSSDGDSLTELEDGEELVVLDIQTWDDAEKEAYVYWGHIEWKGWDAYVPMYYLERAD